jgi:hypothetical protein
MKTRVKDFENSMRLQELRRMSAAEVATTPAGGRILLALHQARDAYIRQKLEEAEAKAREALALAAANPSEPVYGDAVFDANILLGKAAMRRGDRKAAVRHLLTAADTPGSDRLRLGFFEMNLPRALVDWGERRAVADFLLRMAPKTGRAKQLQDWAADLAKGVNPDLFPTFSAPGCTNDPC